jgi:hypothetical protein
VLGPSGLKPLLIHWPPDKIAKESQAQCQAYFSEAGGCSPEVRRIFSSGQKAAHPAQDSPPEGADAAGVNTSGGNLSSRGRAPFAD